MERPSRNTSPAGVPCPARRTASRASGEPFPCSARSRMGRSGSRTWRPGPTSRNPRPPDSSPRSRPRAPSSRCRARRATGSARTSWRWRPGSASPRARRHRPADARRGRPRAGRGSRPLGPGRLDRALRRPGRLPESGPGSRLDRHPDPAPCRVVGPGLPRAAPRTDALSLPRRAARGVHAEHVDGCGGASRAPSCRQTRWPCLGPRRVRDRDQLRRRTDRRRAAARSWPRSTSMGRRTASRNRGRRIGSPRRSAPRHRRIGVRLRGAGR